MKKARTGSCPSLLQDILGALSSACPNVVQLTTFFASFFIHKSIANLAQLLVDRTGVPGEGAMLFPSHNAAVHCRDFMLRQGSTIDEHSLRILDFVPSPANESNPLINSARFSSIFYPKSLFKHAKTFWQHTGEGVSSRRAEYCRKMIEEGLLVERTAADDLQRLCKGPKRYRKMEDAVAPKSNSTSGAAEIGDRSRFVEERFGRNLNMEMASDAKLAIDGVLPDLSQKM